MKATINIHADRDEDLNPFVNRLGSTSFEAFALMLDGPTGCNSVFLSRAGLARVRDKLVAACEEWPVAKVEAGEAVAS